MTRCVAAATRPAVRLTAVVLGVALFGAAGATVQTPTRQAPLIVVFVVDGLRPDSINSRDTPTIARLRDAGAEYLNSHSIFPTVTRVNAAALVTGAHPDATGIVGNVMFVAGVNAGAPFNTSDHRSLLKLEEVSGRTVTAQTLGEVLQMHGRRLVTLSSGSTGSGFLLNPQARHGAGVAISGMFERGVTAAYPQAASEAILQRFGPPPAGENDAVPRMQWTDTVLRDYVLPELRPDVVIDWEDGVDSTQHTFGAGSSQAIEGLKAVDLSIGQTLARIETLGLTSRTDVLVLSDHGFARHAPAVGVVQALIAAGLKGARDSTDVIVASDGEALLLYVQDHTPERVAGVARFLQQQPWAAAIFTAPGTGISGRVPGTFSRDLIHASHATRAADVIVSLAWTDDPNEFGVRGTQTVNTGAGANGHGGLSPWVVHNTLIASGPDFRRQAKISAPAAIPDLAPTMLAILGINDSRGVAGPSAGRILRELLRDGLADARLPARRRVVTVSAGTYRASLQISSVAGHDYVDKGWRER